MATTKRTDLDALEAAPDLSAFDDLGGVLRGMRTVVQRVNAAKTIEVTDDPFEFLSLMVKLMKYAPPGVYAMLPIDEDRPPPEVDDG